MDHRSPNADAPPATSSSPPHRLPPGQARTNKFPVVGERRAAATAPRPADWSVMVDGEVRSPLLLSYEQILAEPRQVLTTDIHCVTGWSHFGMRFDGFPLRRLLDRAEPLDSACFVRFVAASERGHDTSLPLDLACRQTWLVYGRDGEPLEPEHGGPLRTVTPGPYFYKSLKWLCRIELLPEDRLGYWERESSYHNVGDPWAGDQRFTTGSLRPEVVERFRSATSFARYRGEKKVMIGLDLDGWQPQVRELGALHLKSCRMRGARLAGVDLRAANLSLSDLTGADLSGACLRGADLEGVCFAGADLRGADLRDTALCAARFFVPRDGEADHPAKVAGLRWQGATGLLEDQELFLLNQAP